MCSGMSTVVANPLRARNEQINALDKPSVQGYVLSYAGTTVIRCRSDRRYTGD